MCVCVSLPLSLSLSLSPSHTAQRQPGTTSAFYSPAPHRPLGIQSASPSLFPALVSSLSFLVSASPTPFTVPASCSFVLPQPPRRPPATRALRPTSPFRHALTSFLPFCPTSHPPARSSPCSRRPQQTALRPGLSAAPRRRSTLRCSHARRARFPRPPPLLRQPRLPLAAPARPRPRASWPSK